MNHSSSWISSDAQSDRLRFFLRLDRCLLCLLRCWRWRRWTLFKDNLSFPGNVGADDLLSKLLQIGFDIRDSLFQGFVFVWHMFVPMWIWATVPFPVRRHASVADQSALG